MPTGSRRTAAGRRREDEEILAASWLRGPLPDVSPAVAPGADPARCLTRRERDVLRYLPTRLSNMEIAARLRISQNTVKTHLKGIYRKLRVGCRNDAIVAAARNGLFTSGGEGSSTAGGGRRRSDEPVDPPEEDRLGPRRGTELAVDALDMGLQRVD